ncbi:MAG: DNA polymerase III subunit delta [Acidobacteria bacterium]|nr:MAG: DNA polymerase III subunit delta [Acidobacteriota bacterium]
MVGGKAFDSFLADQAVEKIVAAAIGDDRGDALEVLRGDETGWARVVEAARTGSLFAPRRAVVVRGAEALKGEGAEMADKRRAIWKTILDRAAVVLAEPMKEAALRRHVTEEVRRRKLLVTQDGIAELVERVGPDLRRLMGELEKLEAFAEGGRNLTAEEVAAVLGRGRARPLYKLGDAVAMRQAGRALGFMEELLEEGEDALRILGTLHRSLRQVRGALGLQAARATREQMLAALRLNGPFAFKLNGLLDAAGGWSDEELAGALAALERADGRLKSGAEPRSTLAAALLEGCGPKKEGARSAGRTRR